MRIDPRSWIANVSMSRRAEPHRPGVAARSWRRTHWRAPRGPARSPRADRTPPTRSRHRCAAEANSTVRRRIDERPVAAVDSPVPRVMSSCVPDSHVAGAARGQPPRAAACGRRRSPEDQPAFLELLCEPSWPSGSRLRHRSDATAGPRTTDVPGASACETRPLRRREARHRLRSASHPREPAVRAAWPRLSRSSS